MALFTQNITAFQVIAKNAPIYGMLPRGSSYGCGDGSNYIESFFVAENSMITIHDFSGYATCAKDESQLFWSDLSYNKLLKGEYGVSLTGAEFVDSILPKVLDDAYVIAANGDMQSTSPFGYTLLGYADGSTQNQVDNMFGTNDYFPLSTEEAFTIDKKLDNGSPLSGNVYTLDLLPNFNAMPSKGVLNGCSIDNGDGTSDYDLSNDSNTACYIKVRSSAF